MDILKGILQLLSHFLFFWLYYIAIQAVFGWISFCIFTDLFTQYSPTGYYVPSHAQDNQTVEDKIDKFPVLTEFTF